MKKLLEQLNRALDGGRDAVLVTVVASSGSTPRGMGARMLVTDAGRVYGTIGGGAVEHRAEQLAAEVLAAKSSRTERFALHMDEARDLGMVCGGEMTVHFHCLSPKNGSLPAVLQAAGELLASGGTGWLITGLFPGGGLSLYGPGREPVGPEIPAGLLGLAGPAPRLAELDGRAWYIEPLPWDGVVYIFGGGHVSQALVPVLAAADFRCQVIEDREEFCRPGLFPGAERTRLLQPQDFERALSIGPGDYVCVLTRGHKDDAACEAFALRTPARYIGVIGSKKKTAAVNAQLKEQGFTDSDLSRVTTPIGLPIGARTPAEIAVSIAAQLIQVRAAHRERVQTQGVIIP